MRHLCLLTVLLLCTTLTAGAFAHLTGPAINGARWGDAIGNLPSTFGSPQPAPAPMQTELGFYPYLLSRQISIKNRPLEGFISANRDARLNGILYRYTGASSYDIAMAAFQDIFSHLSEQYGQAVNESITGRGVLGHEHYRYRWQQPFTVIFLTADFDGGMGSITIEYLPR